MLNGFGTGSYTVTPSKTGGINGLTSFDAAKVAQHVAGVNPLNGTQLVVADVSANGSVSSLDAGMIAKFVAGPPYVAPGIGTTATWKFNPVSRTYSTVSGSVTGEDYTAFLMGDVSGNWTDSGTRPADWPERSVSVDAPKLVTLTNSEVTIPIEIYGADDKGIIAYEFELRYDPKVIQPQAEVIDLKGTASKGLTAVTNGNEPGVLRVVMYGAYPIDKNNVLLNLRFTAVGPSGSVSPLTWEGILFNEGGIRISAADGKVELSTKHRNVDH